MLIGAHQTRKKETGCLFNMNTEEQLGIDWVEKQREWRHLDRLHELLALCDYKIWSWTSSTCQLIHQPSSQLQGKHDLLKWWSRRNRMKWERRRCVTFQLWRKHKKTCLLSMAQTLQRCGLRCCCRIDCAWHGLSKPYPVQLAIYIYKQARETFQRLVSKEKR